MELGVKLLALSSVEIYLSAQSKPVHIESFTFDKEKLKDLHKVAKRL